jgi:hypothetical protein
MTPVTSNQWELAAAIRLAELGPRARKIERDPRQEP